MFSAQGVSQVTFLPARFGACNVGVSFLAASLGMSRIDVEDVVDEEAPNGVVDNEALVNEDEEHGADCVVGAWQCSGGEAAFPKGDRPVGARLPERTSWRQMSGMKFRFCLLALGMLR